MARASGTAALGAGLLLLSSCSAILGIDEAHVDSTFSVSDQDAAPAQGSADAATGERERADAGYSCDRSDKPQIEVTDDINVTTTWGCQFDYVLKQIVRVNEGATLRIEAGTTIKGVPGQAPPDFVEPGTLIVARGAKIEALGTPTRPIVFTSTAQPGFQRPGQWGGLVLLGNAFVNQGTPGVEGVPSGGEYGGTDDSDSSGALRYLRIEYAGFTLSTGKEINGLTLAGVGRGTEIDHVQVRRVADDCFEFFGGNVDAKYLACQGAEDDGFDFDFGYHGRLQFLILQQEGSHPNLDDAMNGIEADNESQALAVPSKPRTEPVIFNMTLCGQGKATPTEGGDLKDRFGMLWRRGARGRVVNSVILGFEAGLDIRDPLTSVQIEASAFFANAWGTPRSGNIAYPEEAGGTGVLADDDGGFNELVAYAAGNREVDPGVIDCFAPNAPSFAPGQVLTLNAVQPPDDGFFLPVKYLGAVRDADDGWWREAWMVWSGQ
jgi:hypothetical protein